MFIVVWEVIIHYWVVSSSIILWELINKLFIGFIIERIIDLLMYEIVIKDELEMVDDIIKGKRILKEDYKICNIV